MNLTHKRQYRADRWRGHFAPGSRARHASLPGRHPCYAGGLLVCHDAADLSVESADVLRWSED